MKNFSLVLKTIIIIYYCLPVFTVNFNNVNIKFVSLMFCGYLSCKFRIIYLPECKHIYKIQSEILNNFPELKYYNELKNPVNSLSITFFFFFNSLQTGRQK